MTRGRCGRVNEDGWMCRVDVIYRHTPAKRESQGSRHALCVKAAPVTFSITTSYSATAGTTFGPGRLAAH